MCHSICVVSVAVCAPFCVLNLFLFFLLSLTLGVHAQRVTVLGLCVSVCVCVDDYSHATGYKRTIERYQRPQRYRGLKNNVAILLKRRRSGDMSENK